MSLELPHTTHQHQHHQREHHHVELGAACNASTANMARAHKYAHSKNSKHIRAMLRTKAMRDVNRMRFLLQGTRRRRVRAEASGAPAEPGHASAASAMAGGPASEFFCPFEGPFLA